MTAAFTRRDVSWRGERSGVVEAPDGIVLSRHRDLQGRERGLWPRRATLVLIAAIALAGLLNVFGQRPQTTHAAAPAATLELYAPARARSGLLYEARFTIHANDDLKSAGLLLSPGWGEGQSMNTLEPSPVGEASRNGDFFFKLGHIGKGHVFRFFMQFQINPTNVGRRAQNVALYHGNTRVLAIHRTITIFP
jgi:hypothetical protein